MKQRIDESLTRLSEELADAMPRRGFIRRLGAFVALFTVFGTLERVFAQAYADKDCGPVIGLARSSGGSGYPNGSLALVFTGGGGTGATGTATVAGGVITSVSLTNGGSGYSSAPTVTVAGGTGAIIVAGINSCTNGADCSKTGSECGNGGYKCSGVVKTSTDKNDPCCNCTKGTDDSCPPPLVSGSSRWLACCLCSETPTSKRGKVYQYVDCCKTPDTKFTKDCPKECYVIGPQHCPGSSVAVGCVTGSAGDGDKGWCGIPDGKYLCTLPGKFMDKCCEWS